MPLFSKKDHPLSDREFREVLSFFQSIVGDLYVTHEGWYYEMKEYTYEFRNVHKRVIGNDYYIIPVRTNQQIWIRIDSAGRYHCCGKTFSNLRDAQLTSLMREFVFFEQYCDYMGI